MRGNIICLLTLVFILVGCGAENEEGMNGSDNQNQIDPINYETPQEQRDRVGEREKSIGELGGYPQSEQKFINEGDKNISAKNEDRYTNERTLLISEYLAERKEIVQAQVVETKDRIIVAIQTENHEYPNLNKIVEEEVRQIEPSKQIVVYTDDNYWERMRNLNSKKIDFDDNIRDTLDNFFGND
ncbi:YhcN/YlaJ family sporulation lipoprotein [Ornithinibacillus xuwenensis]|uniref:YhcN/YlaJ family sporulation lipoprotein n=1 Tax=Ornithinibacillus xuwenensis TaxID=3144668 RepID=A0ABU9XC82_9BACI